jgi:pimeloyl-ACP methyl ester carboxylesterase
VRKAFIRISSGQIHYRSAGQGAPVVMLHPSPLSSAAVLPVAKVLAQHFRVYALDTPGYGLSEAPTRKPQSLDDYLPLLAETLDALGLARVCLYGAATGAQIGVEFARRYPERVALLVMDTAGHISAEDCAQFIDDYFPDVRPQKDGRHLVTLWNMVRDLFVFFPWCDTRARSRVSKDLPPPSVMQNMLLDYLRAGPRYDWAYRPAFHNERAERVQALKVPTVLTRWVDSVALPITDALIAEGLPPNVTVLPLAATLAARGAGIATYLRSHYRDVAAAGAAPAVKNSTMLERRYADLPDGQLHSLTCLQGSGRPILALHSPAASAALLQPIVAPLQGQRPVIALDLPGNGESDALLPDAEISMENYARYVAAALDALGVDEVDVLGRYMGGNVGLELSRLAPRRVKNLVFLGLPLFAPAERDRMIREYCPSIAPQWDGGHLQRAWYMMRDQSLWYPYFDTRATSMLRSEPNLDPHFIHLRVTEVMKMGDRYRAAYAAEFSYPLAERLGATSANTILASAAWEALGHRRADASISHAQTRAVDLPDRFGDWAQSLLPHLK